ncbi:hypothetical protein Mal15_39340 [Stieleria maiorica]|uniref:Uncharacterized protein n=1 Tax=Stieleria maiorica TaxID=2795974 RepID=A0A5B9MLX4_9BACT|nr:hypothetical protein [Stieleria maiorica]QEF99867.1 hypothetical protein Mal15_39340 [Stieleria maiorica]
MGPEINPYAAPRTVPARPPLPVETLPGRRRLKIAVVIASLILIGSPIASALAMSDIETIVISGPVLSLIAIVLAIFAWRSDLRALWIISYSMIAMSIGCFLTIVLMEWSPAEAQIPIGRATIVFAFGIQAGWLAMWNVWARRRTLEWQNDEE